jgi:group II intron reverse transcriptase/maturase
MRGGKGLASGRSFYGNKVPHRRRKGMGTVVERIRQIVAEHPDRRHQTVMHCVNKEELFEAHKRQGSKKAAGIDGTVKAEYAENLEANIESLLSRMKRFSYRPQPVRRVYIPKEGGGKERPLGIPAYEDRLVQSCMAEALSAIYEPRFHDFSFGFRPGRSQHQAIAYLDDKLMGKTNWVLDADIKGFFDNVDHRWMMKFLEHEIEDKNFLRYVVRFLKAGVMEEGKYEDTEAGVPQGGTISPVLANVYLHYVVDEWFAKVAKPKIAKGECSMVRFADDIVFCFQNENDARAMHEALKARLAKFELELSEDKTKLLKFGRFAGAEAQQFDFLGFTFMTGKTRKGKYTVIKVTSRKKLKQKQQKASKWLRRNMHQPIKYIIGRLNMSLRGHYNYYGLSHNIHRMATFYNYILLRLKYWLGRRSQKGYLSWEKYNRMLKHFPLLKPAITRPLWQA